MQNIATEEAKNVSGKIKTSPFTCPSGRLRDERSLGMTQKGMEGDMRDWDREE